MNNLLDFTEYVNEKRKWNKIFIRPEKKPENGTVDVAVSGELDDDTNKEIKSILADDYETLVSVTGKNNVHNFMEVVRKKMDIIAPLKNRSNGLLDTDGKVIKSPLNYTGVSPDGKPTFFKIELTDEYHKDLDKTSIETIFNLTPEKGSNLGKGEVLLASYYHNIMRSLEKNEGGEPGDCLIISKDGKTRDDFIGYIEVKSSIAHFDVLGGQIYFTNEDGKKQRKKISNDIIEKIINENYLNDIEFSFRDKPGRKSNKDLENDSLSNDDINDIKIDVEEIENNKKELNHVVNRCLGGFAKYLLSQSQQKKPFNLVFFCDENYESGPISYYCTSVPNIDKIDKIDDIIRNNIIGDCINKISLNLPNKMKNDKNASFDKFTLSISSDGTMNIYVI